MGPQFVCPHQKKKEKILNNNYLQVPPLLLTCFHHVYLRRANFNHLATFHYTLIYMNLLKLIVRLQEEKANKFDVIQMLHHKKKRKTSLMQITTINYQYRLEYSRCKFTRLGANVLNHLNTNFPLPTPLNLPTIKLCSDLCIHQNFLYCHQCKRYT